MTCVAKNVTSVKRFEQLRVILSAIKRCLSCIASYEKGSSAAGRVKHMFRADPDCEGIYQIDYGGLRVVLAVSVPFFWRNQLLIHRADYFEADVRKVVVVKSPYRSAIPRPLHPTQRGECFRSLHRKLSRSHP